MNLSFGMWGLQGCTGHVAPERRGSEGTWNGCIWAHPSWPFLSLLCAVRALPLIRAGCCQYRTEELEGSKMSQQDHAPVGQLLGRNFQICYFNGWGFPGSTHGKEPTCQCRGYKISCISISKRSLGQENPRSSVWQPTPAFLHGGSHEQRSLVGYSPWGRQELDTSESP